MLVYLKLFINELKSYVYFFLSVIVSSCYYNISVISHESHMHCPGIECGMAKASVAFYEVCAQYPPKLPATMTNVLDVFHMCT
jgi:hypothetical protein